MGEKDRLEKLLDPAQTTFTGLDFIYVHANQTTLDVYFLKPPAELAPSLVNHVKLTELSILSLSGGENKAVVPVKSRVWLQVDARGHESFAVPDEQKNVLRLETVCPGDFSRYVFCLDHAQVDPFFQQIEFTFKANCKSYLDCKRQVTADADTEWVDVPVDYQARDFWSMRQALLDFASLRYPGWQDRLEADAGVMLAETLSAVTDEMAYYQDRVGREAYLATASQRRSLRQHARLMDYNVHDGLGARGWLVITADGSESAVIAGANVTDAAGERMYEVGRGLADVMAETQYPLDPLLNVLSPHVWDEDSLTLPAGSTCIYLQGAWTVAFDDFTGDRPGKWMMLYEEAANPVDPVRAQAVRVVGVTHERDELFNADITRLDWEAVHALPYALNLEALKIYGNVVPVTSGVTRTEYFTIQAAEHAEASWPEALEREGAQDSVAYRFSLPGSDEGTLVWLGTNPRLAEPELVVREMEWSSGSWVPKFTGEWMYRRTLVGEDSSQSTDAHFTLEDGFWKRVVGYRRAEVPDEIVHRDYASGEGWTLRFGDGEFGRLPVEGTVFEVTYRLGHGETDNALAGTLSFLDAPGVTAAVNLQDIQNGMDPETAAEIRQLAPEEFKALTYRAVRPEDYAEAVERLDWVQRAGGTFRYTGSWLSAFVTPDPKGTYEISPLRQQAAQAQLNRFRQAGREAYVCQPVYATLDFVIQICVAPTAYPGEVKERVLAALLGSHGPQGSVGFFSPDHYSFGTPLYRSQLEKAIQDVEGVNAVLSIHFRRRGWFDWRPLRELIYQVGDDEVIRVENDRDFPERGSVKLVMKGGA